MNESIDDLKRLLEERTRELKSAEARFRNVINRNADGIIIVDSSGIVCFVNYAAESLFGRKASELIGAAFGFPIVDGETTEIDIIRKGGETVIAEMRVVETEWEGRAAHLASLRDITDRKRAEEGRAELIRKQAARAEDEAQKANRLKDEFLATLSHELRTPLTALLGWAQMLRKRSLEGEALDYALDTIERNARAQTQIIEDILDVSNIIRGKLELNIQKVALDEIIEAAINSVRPAAEAKAIRLAVSIENSVGQISGDRDRLLQVVWNLLTNSIKFTPKGGRVEIRLKHAEDGRPDATQPGKDVEIIVSDTGQGINREFLPHVFERFSQADSSSTREHGGLGLGLALVRHLVEMHGGTVQADSAGPGQGATFTIRLPLV